jgi:predicted Zn-dependent protease
MPTSRTTPLTTSLPRLAALFATVLSTSACFDSSWFQGKSSQQSVAQARTPQTLRGTQGDGDSPPPTLAKVRTMRVRARATPRHIAEITDWQRRFSEMLEDANRVLVPTLSVRLEITTATEWSPRAPDDALAAQLAELAATDPGDDVDWVIGLTGSVPRFEESFRELGMAHMPGKHAVLRAINDARELEAIEKAFPDLSEADRSKLFLARKRHKRATVLLHEIGHTLGAPHQPVPSAIMTPRYGIAVESYGPAAAELLRVAVDDRRTPASERNPRALAEASIAVLRRWPDQWTADEREQAIARLQQQRQASPARTAATPPPAPPSVTDTGLDALTPDHRATYDRAAAAQTQGRDAEAWAEATPLFDVYPGVAAVQDLRCRLAMKLRSWSEAKKECAALVPEARPRREVPPQERKKR